MPDSSRWESNESEHFNEAYRGRPLLILFVASLWVAVLALLGFALYELFAGKFVIAFLSGGGAVGFLVVWYLLHNWALVNPK